ncbi:MAG: coproporphyrinogen dehydrogenase HemZ [Clostridiales bacterium]|nr:coproporphyrinogen dehydrogenase HemZ [Candidatus Scatonaster coprocaballi]
MLKIHLVGHTHDYPLCDVVRLLTGIIPRCTDGCITVETEWEATIRSEVTESEVLTALENGPETSILGQKLLRTSLDGERTVDGLPISRALKIQLYTLLSELLEKTFPWGSLTGIRPTQVARELSRPEEMTRIYGVREDKAKLAFLTRDGEDQVLMHTDPNHLHVYIGIPFCPTRCAYCSFIAQEAPNKRELLPSYVDAMLEEMDRVLPTITRKIETLYIGGGTPTVLDDELFTRFIHGVFAHEAFQHLKEVCVEAGRPDTITHRKLEVLLEVGVTRICINPQTLCDATLLRVGRKHTAADFEKAFELARSMGFTVINTDLIAGLPGESAEEFCESLSRIVELAPENITVHSLSKKRRSDLSREEIVRQEKTDLLKMEKMLSFAFETLSEAGYVPYYLYKQKDTIGGHENVGYQKDGTPCIYNVAMMSDARSVLSFGAGGMSKRVYPEGESIRVERCSCIKDPIQYIQNVQNMAEKKIAFFKEEGTEND